MKTPVKRYVEIFEEKVENGKSVLRYYGYDHKMHTIGSGDLQVLVDCMGAEVFPNGVPNFDGKERFLVESNLKHCVLGNHAVRTASPYECKLIADSNYTVTNERGKIALGVTVAMGGDDITSTAYSYTTGIIKIAEVTDDIAITVEAQSPGT